MDVVKSQSYIQVKYYQNLIATSLESQNCVQKAAFLNLCTIRVLQPNEKRTVTGDILEKQVKEDVEEGPIPFFIVKWIRSKSL